MAGKRNRRNTTMQREVSIDWTELGKLVFSAIFITICIFAARMIEDVSIKSIHVNSKIVRVSKIEISEIVKRYEMDGFFTVNLRDFEAELNSLDWVYKANIKRQWPYGLIIDIEEQTPVFRWNQQQLMNKYGQVFTAQSDESFAHRPHLIGQSGRALYLADLYNRYNQQFLDLGISIKSLQEDARYDKVMTLSNGVRINMGRGDAEMQMHHCIGTLALLSDEERAAIASIDLRHTNGLAVSWNS